MIGELGGPETDRVRTALDEGWATIIDAPSPTDGDSVAILGHSSLDTERHYLQFTDRGLRETFDQTLPG